MSIDFIYQKFLSFPNISTDSRNVTKNSIFFALKGDKFDGNVYAEKALQVCAYAIVDDESVVQSERYILVNDSLEALQKLAQLHRRELNIPILAITGTNGKTTTKEIVARILKQKYNVWATLGNLNNHIGVPLTILQMNKDTQFGVVEMGANHQGEIAALCEIAQPDFGIITNVGKAHIEGFKSMNGVKKAKGELYSYLYMNNGMAFIHSDDETLQEMDPPRKTIFYGTSKFTHCQGTILPSDLFVEMKWEVSDASSDNYEEILNNPNRSISSQLYGSYNFINILAAVCVGEYFKVPDVDIKKAVENYKPSNNRSQLVETENNKVVLDAYNANPSSVKVALENFIKISHKSKVVILGDMLELGDIANVEHCNIAYSLENTDLDKIFYVGSIYSNLKLPMKIQSFETYEILIQYLTKNPIKNSLILVKGSRAVQLEKLIPVL